MEAVMDAFSRYAASLARLAGALIALTGVAVCVSWVTGAQGALRVLPSSNLVHFNTGLMFAGSGIALVAAMSGWRKTPALAGGIVLALAALTLVQYLLDVDLGVDRWFTAGWPQASRVAPNTAATFVLVGVAFLLLVASRRAAWAGGIVPMLGAIVLGIGGIAVLGYAVNLPAAFRWAGLTQMAFVTALALTLLGAALILAAVRSCGASRLEELPWLAATAGTALAVLSLLGWYALRQTIGSGPAYLADVLVALGIAAAALLAGAIAQARHLHIQSRQLAAANTALHATSEEVRDLYERAPCGYHSLDENGCVVRMNQTELDWLGYTREEVAGRSYLSMLVPHSQALMRASFERFKQTGRVNDLEAEVVRKDGSVLPILLSSTAVYDAQGRFLRSRSTLIDMTERKRAEEALRESETRLQLLLDTLQTAVVVHGSDTAIRYVNPTAATILGLTRDQLLGKTTIDPAWHFVREDGRPMPLQEYPVSLVFARREAIHDYVVGIHVAEGQPTRWALVNAIPDLDAEGRVRQVIVSFMDISERQRQAAELEHLALTDSLTGLATRRHFMSASEREIARCRRDVGEMSLLILDIDHFKRINDEHGHASGDRVLVELARVLRATLRDTDVAGRLGGEEFCVLLPQAAEDVALQIAERVRRAVAAATARDDGGASLRFTASLGIASLEPEDPDLASILHRADLAMYQAKRAGRNRVGVLPRRVPA